LADKVSEFINTTSPLLSVVAALAAGAGAAGVVAPCLQAVILPAINKTKANFVSSKAFFIIQFLR
jgi:hypothetical protein